MLQVQLTLYRSLSDMQSGIRHPGCIQTLTYKLYVQAMKHCVLTWQIMVRLKIALAASINCLIMTSHNTTDTTSYQRPYSKSDFR